MFESTIFAKAMICDAGVYSSWIGVAGIVLPTASGLLRADQMLPKVAAVLRN